VVFPGVPFSPPPPHAVVPPSGQGQDPAAVRALPAFADRRVADAGNQPAPERVAGRAVVPPEALERDQPRPGPLPPSHSGVKELRTQAEFDAALASGTPMVVKWYGPQCGPCRVLAPAFEDAARELDGQVAFYSVNSHGEGAPNIPQVQSLPGLAYYEGGRLLTHRNGLPAGVRAREALKNWLIGALANRAL
jgi:thiol-disulfide isomerase/thioredoxin